MLGFVREFPSPRIEGVRRPMEPTEPGVTWKRKSVECQSRRKFEKIEVLLSGLRGGLVSQVEGEWLLSSFGVFVSRMRNQ